MKHNREFEIAWQGLKPGMHEYSFNIGDDFMKEREAPDEYHNWNAEIKLSFDKHDNFFQMHFDVAGTVIVPCDRCGDEFTLNLWDEFDLMVKLTGGSEDEEEQEEEADIVFIPRHETVLDISKWVYEFVMLSVPLQKVHPETSNGDGCNPEALRLLNQLSEPNEAEKRNIWKGLEAFKPEESEEENINQVNKRKTK